MGFFDRFRSRRKPGSDLSPDELAQELKDWRIVNAKNAASGEQAIIRIRLSKPSRADVGRLTTAVVVKWSYEGGALPPADVNERQCEFEKALDPLSTKEEAELVQVSTGMGLKEWVYYTHSSEIFMARFNKLLSGHPRFPIQIEFYKDPEWQVWGDMIGSLKARGVERVD